MVFYNKTALNRILEGLIYDTIDHMVIAIGADKKTKTTDAVVGKLKKDGRMVLLFGNLNGFVAADM